MDIERIVVRLFADASQYTAVLGAAETRLLFFSSYLTSVMGNTAISLASDFEKSQVAFEVMTKSAEVGRKLLADITNLAVESPFTSGELISNAKQLKAFGFETNDLVPILSRLGDISSGTGADLDRLVLAFGQVRTTGRLMGQELRQFTNAGVPILEYLGKVLNVTSAQIPNLVRQGRISFSDVAKAINMMTDSGGLFEGMMGRINKETTFGRWQNLQENLQLTARNFGLAFFQAFKVGDALTYLSNNLRGMEQGRIIEFMTGLRQAFEILWEVIVRGYDVLSGYVMQIGAWVESNQEAITSGLALAGVVVGVVAVVGVALARLLFDLQSSQFQLWDFLKSIPDRVANTASNAVDGIKGLWASFMATMSDFSSDRVMASSITDQVWMGFIVYGNTAISMLDGLIGHFRLLWAIVQGAGSGAFDFLHSALTFLFGDLQRVIAVIATTITLVTAWIILVRTIGAVLWVLNGVLWAVRAGIMAVNAAMSLMYVLQSIAAMWASLGSILALVVSPIGLVAMAIAGLIYALDQMKAFDNFGLGFLEGLGKMKDGFLDTYRTIVELVKAGEVAKAFELAGAAIRIAWKSVLIGMEIEWERFSNSLGEMLFGGLVKSLLDVMDLTPKLITRMVAAIYKAATGSDETPAWLKAFETNVDTMRKPINDFIDKQVNDARERGRPATEQRVQDLLRQLDPLREELDMINRLHKLDIQLTPRAQELLRQVEPFTRKKGVFELLSDPDFQQSLGAIAAGKTPPPPKPFDFDGKIPSVFNATPGSDRFPTGLGGMLGGLGIESIEKAHRDVSRDALKSAMDVRKEMMAGRQPTKDMLDNLNNSSKALRVFNDMMDGTAVAASNAAKQIATPLQISADALKAAQELQKEFHKGVGPMDHFNHQLSLITEAFDGPLPEATKNALAAVTGFAAVVGNDNLAGILTPEERDYGYFKQYEELKRKVGRKENSLPPAQFLGTREAQDTINKANTNEQKDVLQEVRDTIKAGLEIQKEHKDYAKEVVKEIKELKNRGIIMPDLRGMNLNDR